MSSNCFNLQSARNITAIDPALIRLIPDDKFDAKLSSMICAIARHINRGRREVITPTADLVAEGHRFVCQRLGANDFAALSAREVNALNKDVEAYLWGVSNGRDAQFYKERLCEGGDLRYIDRFFHSTARQMSAIAPMCDGIIQYFRGYGIEMTREEVENEAHLVAWSGGTWKAVNAFNGDTTFFKYLQTCTLNSLKERCRKDGLIPKKSSRRNAEEKLPAELHAIDHWGEGVMAYVFSEVVANDHHRQVLTWWFMEHLSLEEVSARLGGASAVRAIVKAVAYLKDCCSRYGEELSLTFATAKKQCVKPMSIEDFGGLANCLDGGDEITDPFLAEMQEICGFEYTANELAEKLTDVIHAGEELSFRSDLEREIWMRRYWDDVKAAQVAKELGVDPAQVHIVYSALIKRVASNTRPIIGR